MRNEKPSAIRVLGPPLAILAGCGNFGLAFLFLMGMGMSSRVPVANDPPILGVPGSMFPAVLLFSLPAGIVIAVGTGVWKGWTVGALSGLIYAGSMALFVGWALAGTYLR